MTDEIKKEDCRWAVYSGICMCGHSYLDHHLGMVLNPDYVAVGEYLPEECEFFGSNEFGGVDDEGKEHCWHYVDREHPNEEFRKEWKGTVKFKMVGCNHPEGKRFYYSGWFGCEDCGAMTKDEKVWPLV